MAVHDIELTGFGYAGSCREYTSPRDDERSTPKEWIRGDTKIGPILEVKVTHHLYQHGIEIKIDSMQKGRSQSWIVISRGMNKYVNELSEENGKSIHVEEVTANTGDPLRQSRRNDSLRHYLHSQRLLCQSIDGSGKTFLPLNALMRNHYPSMSRSQWPEHYDTEVFIAT